MPLEGVKVRKAWFCLWAASFLFSTAITATENDVRLVDAVESRDSALARSLLDSGVPVDETQPDGTSALHWASHLEQIDLVDLLLGKGADPNVTNRYGVTPLSLAATNGSPAVITALLDAGARPNTASPYGETPLMTAARTGDAEVVSLLLTAGANVNAKEAWRGQTALMWAAAETNAAAAQVLMEMGADVSARSDGGMTAVLFAARAGHINTVSTLLKGGANLDETADDAIPRAPQKIDDDSEKHAANIEPEPLGLGSSVLATAIRNTHYDLAAWLVSEGADINADGPRGTALHGLIRARNCELTAMPCPEQKAQMGSLALAEMLLAHDADVNARMSARPPTKGTYDGNSMSLVGATPLFLAVKAADLPMTHLLLRNGADPTIGNEDDTIPLLVAAGMGFIAGQVAASEAGALETVKLLVDLGQEVTFKNSNDETALHGAAYRGADSIVRFLVERGADLDAEDDKGLLPVTVADGFRRSGGFQAHPETAALLRELMGPNAPERRTDQGSR